MAMVIELLIVISLVASEVLERHEAPPAPAAGMAPLVEPVEAVAVVEALAPRPRLIASQRAPVGRVVEVMADIMEPGRRRVEIADLFSAYADACEARGKRPIPANQFPAEVAALCNQVGIELEDTGDGVYLRKVKLRRQAGRKAG